MALFRRKPPTDDGDSGNGSGGNGGDGGNGGFEPQPEKARKWFERAQTLADSSNYAYALECYANGLKLDPGSMSAHDAMLTAAHMYMVNGGKPAAGREARSFEDGTPIGKFAAAEFEWMKDLKNHKLAVKALEAAVKAEQIEWGHWVAPRVALLLRQKKKLGKGALIQAMELFGKVEAWDESLTMGEMARQLDPADNALDAELKNLTAQRAMDQGGYTENIGEEGGFRSSVRDIEKQKELIEEESLSGGATVEQRNLERACIAYEENPKVPDNINKYAQLLKISGRDGAEEQARQIYMKGFEETGEYRFRMYAGDILIEQLERRRRALGEQLEEDPDDEAAKTERESVTEEMLNLKLQEYSERVKKYPTDRFRKFDLGTVFYELGNYDDAMPHFQTSKDEPRLRVRAGHLLGRCFLAEDWYAEAIAEFEEALQVIDVTERERELPIRYDLMLAMLEAAREEDSIDLARQAKSICSEIARKDITYRDIRTKRKEVDEVIKKIIGG